MQRRKTWRKGRACPDGGNLGGRKGVSGIWEAGYVWGARAEELAGTRLVGMARGSSCWLMGRLERAPIIGCGLVQHGEKGDGEWRCGDLYIGPIRGTVGPS